jgi:rfaE bifunctional protein kinase chain/domain
MEITALSKRLPGIKAIILGDMMLDSYQWGKVQRISPEAPVPVIEINHEEFRLGGAANVALNLKSLGAEVIAVGITGMDQTAKIMRKLFVQKGINPEGLIPVKGRKTTIRPESALQTSR